ncbi:MAG: MFS transporter [Actinobacteria bacterium]|nr:MFS transporter [Actinomycetota bacterium]
MPELTHRDASVLLTTRGLRGFVDGLVSVAIAVLLPLLGFSALQVGVTVTGMLLGSAAVTLFVGTRAHAMPRRTLLFVGAALMIGTGLAFGTFTQFAVLLVVGIAGTLNPTAGDVSMFLPLEQSLLAATTPPSTRTALYARYTFVGGLAGAIGSQAIAIPEAIARHTSVSQATALRACFILYSITGITVWLLYRTLTQEAETVGPPAQPLGPSRAVVYRLAALFSLDAFGGGFIVQSLLVLWLFRRFDLSVSAAGTLLLVTGTLGAASGFVAAWLAARIGLIRTMAFTHLPANCFLIAAALMPTMPLALTMLIARSVLSSMDVPARTSYVMAVVSPPERAAAASVTNVPRSLAAAMSPALAGWMLQHSTFGWPLIIAGTCKILYDLLLLSGFRHLRPAEEQSPSSDPVAK